MKAILDMTSTISKSEKLVHFQATVKMASVDDGKGKYGIQFSLIRDNGELKFVIQTSNGYVFSLGTKERALEILNALLDFKKFKFTTVYKTDVEESGEGFIVSAPYSYTNESDISGLTFDTVNKIKEVLAGEVKL